MKRCFPRLGPIPGFFLSTLLSVALVAVLIPAPASAKDSPQRIPPMAASAKRGVLVVTQPPEVLLNGQAARLSPGARIRGPNNLLLMSGSLVGQELPVSYTLDSLGLVHQVWILTHTELQAKP